jgi:hypothetical protein
MPHVDAQRGRCSRRHGISFNSSIRAQNQSSRALLLIPSVTAIAYDVWFFFFVSSLLQSRDIMVLCRLQDFKADALLPTIADALSSPQAAIALVAGLNR